MSFDKEAAFIQRTLTLHSDRYIYDRTHFQFQTASFTYGRLVDTPPLSVRPIRSNESHMTCSSHA